MNDPGPEHIKLFCPGGEIRKAEMIQGSSQSFSFDDLEPGSYTVDIDDPRYLPWRSAMVQPGVDVAAHLEGSSAVALTVLDAQGNAVSDYSARVEFRNVDLRPNEFEVQPIRGLLKGMFPGDFTIRVKAGELLGAAEVDALGTMETREVTVVVGSGNTLAGRVIHAGGTPVADVEVLLLLPAEVDDSASSPVLTRNMSTEDEAHFRREVDSAVTDEQGRFRFVLTREGTHVVHAWAGGFEVSSEVVAASTADTRELELVLPRGGLVRGTLRGPDGEAFAGFRVAAEQQVHANADPLAWRMRMHRLNDTDRSVAEVAKDGRFELGPVPAGPVTIYFLLPEHRVRFGRGSVLGDSNSNRMEIGRLTIEEDAIVERQFEIRELLGTLALDVTVNGELTAGLRLQIQGEEGSGFHLNGETDAKGTFGPTFAFAGSWFVMASDPERGWIYSSPVPLVVTPSAETRGTIAIEVTTAKLLYIDRERQAAGQPANRGVPVEHFLSSRKTSRDRGGRYCQLHAHSRRIPLRTRGPRRGLLPASGLRTAIGDAHMDV